MTMFVATRYHLQDPSTPASAIAILGSSTTSDERLRTSLSIGDLCTVPGKVELTNKARAAVFGGHQGKQIGHLAELGHLCCTEQLRQPHVVCQIDQAFKFCLWLCIRL